MLLWVGGHDLSELESPGPCRRPFPLPLGRDHSAAFYSGSRKRSWAPPCGFHLYGYCSCAPSGELEIATSHCRYPHICPHAGHLISSTGENRTSTPIAS